jgi:hypothetical protein
MSTDSMKYDEGPLNRYWLKLALLVAAVCGGAWWLLPLVWVAVVSGVAVVVGVAVAALAIVSDTTTQMDNHIMANIWRNDP